MNQSATMNLAQRDSQFDGQSQKPVQIHWCAEKPVEWLAARIPEYQLGPSFVPNAGDRLSSPGWIQLAAEIEFVLKTLKAFCGRVLRGRGNYQNRRKRPLSAATIKNELFARPQLVQAILRKINYHRSVFGVLSPK